MISPESVELLPAVVVAEDHEQYEKVKEERIRARSAVIGGVQKNEFQRRKMNEIRLIQAKTKREEEKRLKKST